MGAKINTLRNNVLLEKLNRRAHCEDLSIDGIILK
jgi:hypothetical protein